jgi:MraZ protein
MMFRGPSAHTIDVKGRLIIPARFRDVVRTSGVDGLIVTTFDSCLYAYTIEEWGKLEEKIIAQPESNIKMRNFKRFFIGNASECMCDKQGRILIPPELRQYAGLEKEVKLIGVINHFEIWSKSIYEQKMSTVIDSYDSGDLEEISMIGL